MTTSTERVREYRATERGRRRTREVSAAASRALWQLKALYPNEYARLYAAALAEIRMAGGRESQP